MFKKCLSLFVNLSSFIREFNTTKLQTERDVMKFLLYLQHNNDSNRKLDAFKQEAVRKFELNDILEEKLMPSLLLTEPLNRIMDERNSSLLQSRSPSIEMNCSDFKSALTTMDFHRQMMNEFLATTFLAKELFKPLEVLNFSRRIGTVTGSSESHDMSNVTRAQSKEEQIQRKSRQINNHRLLMDEGSTSYKDWLERSTTLKDIHRQFEELGLPTQNATLMHTERIRHKSGSDRRTASEDIDIVEDEQEYDEGDITGYAMSSSQPEVSQSRFNSANYPVLTNEAVYKNSQSSIPLAQLINKNGYEASYDSYGAQHPQQQTHPYIHAHSPPQANPQPHIQPHLHSYPPSHPPNYSAVAQVQNKEISLKDITDIALTTLAFLSFGMFILQVLMCITMGKEDTTNMMMLPMEATDNQGEIPDDGTEEIRRRKRRSTKSFKLAQMNGLVRQALHSINAVLNNPENNGSCHFLSICEHNKFSNTKLNGQKLWIPIWSLGISWLTSRYNVHSGDFNPDGDYAQILKSLKASIIGLANENCAEYYRKTC